MVTIADTIIYIVVFSLVQKGNAEDICLMKQNATSGRKGVLTCTYPFRIGDGSTVMYWKNRSHLICYVKISEEINCVGLQHDTADRKMILTIPNLKVTDSGRYTCNVYTKNNSFECNIDLDVAVGRRQMRSGSNGIRLKAGPMLLLLPLALFIGSYPFISL